MLVVAVPRLALMVLIDVACDPALASREPMLAETSPVLAM